MQEANLGDVLQGISVAFHAKNYDKAAALLWPALDQYPNNQALWFYAGGMWYVQEMHHPALLAYQRCLEIGHNPHILINMGATYRRLNDYDNGIRVLSQAVAELPDNPDAAMNLGALYVNEGNPHPGIPLLRRAGEAGKWNLGLLLLEAGEFREGFDLYRTGLHESRLVRVYQGPDGDYPLYSPEQPRAGKTLVIWGEQGIGDELMFGTMIEEARAEFGEVILECHHRLERMHRHAHPGMRIFPTRKDAPKDVRWPILEKIRADYKMPIGDLGALYRPDRESFARAWQARGPFYHCDDAERHDFRRLLEMMANGRPIVGLATRGGTFSTARTHRSLSAQQAAHIIRSTDAYFVSLDYEDMAGFAAGVAHDIGPNRYGVFPAVVAHGGDYHHDGALAAACDMVVTVCQSIAHLSAGMGLRTRVLTPKRVAWRYGISGEQWFLYPGDHCKLLRQSDPDSWDEPLERVIAEIRTLC